jgi:hypothetical protein
LKTDLALFLPRSRQRFKFTIAMRQMQRKRWT